MKLLERRELRVLGNEMVCTACGEWNTLSVSVDEIHSQTDKGKHNSSYSQESKYYGERKSNTH